MILGANNDQTCCKGIYADESSAEGVPTIALAIDSSMEHDQVKPDLSVFCTYCIILCLMFVMD